MQDKILTFEAKIKQYSILSGELPNPTKRYINNLANIYAGAQPIVALNSERKKSVERELKLPRLLSKKAAQNIENLKEKYEAIFDLPVKIILLIIISALLKSIARKI